jgi:protein O-GlcNAc transferase
MNRQQRRFEARQVRTIGATARPDKTSDTFAMALERHRAGQFGEAESLYRQVLAMDPDHAESHHNLGMIALQFGHADVAVAMIAKAVALNGQEPIFHSGLGQALEAQGAHDEAVAAYNRALTLKPESADVHFNLALTLNNQGNLEQAAASYRRAFSLKPDFAAAHNNLAGILKEQGRLEDAIASYRHALWLSPSYAECHNNLGATLSTRGDLDEAIESYECALRIKPDYAVAHFNLGNAFKDHGKLKEAVIAYERALSLQPNFSAAYNNLGSVLEKQGKLATAAAAYEQAISFRPDFVGAQNNLGKVLMEQGKFEAAEVAYGRALSLEPTFADSHNNLGILLEKQEKFAAAAVAFENALVLKPGMTGADNNLGRVLAAQGKLDEATAAFHRALAINPNDHEAHSDLGFVLMDQGYPDEGLASFERSIAIKPDFIGVHNNLLMGQHYSVRQSNSDLIDSARRFGAIFEKLPPPRVFSNDRSSLRRLRVGYVSGDFHKHPVGFLLTRVLDAHDPSVIDVFCYSNHHEVDDVTRRLQAATAHWRDIRGISDTDAAMMILQDEIDILVDLSGHTARNRLPLFAIRPAPVQVSWLGYFGTTGLPSMDYLLMDEAVLPRGEERWYTETIVRLPYGRFCYSPPEYAPEPVDPPSLDRDYVTFGSFNNIKKIGPEVIRLWAEVMRATPGSRLVLKWSSLEKENLRRRFTDAFAAAGVEAERLELRGFSPHPEMLAQYGEIDIALDSFPFGGGLTSCEALWMGVPVVTLPGDRPASRQTLGFLNLLGLDDLAAESPNDYVARATALAANPDRLTEIRRALRPRMTVSPLCDGAQFTPTLEAAYLEMWKRSHSNNIDFPTLAATN